MACKSVLSACTIFRSESLARINFTVRSSHAFSPKNEQAMKLIGPRSWELYDHRLNRRRFEGDADMTDHRPNMGNGTEPGSTLCPNHLAGIHWPNE